MNSADAGFAISAVGISQTVQNNDIDDYEMYGIETTGNGTTVVGNTITQNSTLVGTGTAVIVNSARPGFAQPAQIAHNLIERAGLGISIWSNAGYASIVSNQVINTTTGIAVDSQDPGTGFEAIGNTIIYDHPAAGDAGVRVAFLTYSTGNKGVKRTRIATNTVQYRPGAWSPVSPTREWMVKVATDNVTITGNTFDAGAGHPGDGVPRVGGEGVSNPGLVVTGNHFLHGVKLSTTGFTRPVLGSNTVD